MRPVEECESEEFMTLPDTEIAIRIIELHLPA
jgi:hypothetical protein